jgi:hypothetical protein
VQPRTQTLGSKILSGRTVIDELIRNMELGQFELAYTVLLPCVFRVYLHPEDHVRLAGVVNLIVEDASRALRRRVSELNRRPSRIWPSAKSSKEFKIACRDWIIEFFPDNEVPPGDVEIHSELNEEPQPGYRGVKTTLTDRDCSVTSHRPTGAVETQRSTDRIYAEIRYEDDSGTQVYLVTQNEIHIGRGGHHEPMDLALYASDEVSRDHLLLRRDPATGAFVIVDQSTNGTWVDGRRLKRGVEEALPDRAQITVAEVVTLAFEVRK